jgi:hypothetical protein
MFWMLPVNPWLASVLVSAERDQGRSWLFNPLLVVDDLEDSSPVCIEAARKIGLRLSSRMRSADGTNSVPRQTSCGMIFGAFKILRTGARRMLVAVKVSMPQSAFGNLVIGIVLVRAKEQVIWVPTWRVVAAVQHEQSAWDGTAMELPGKAMNVADFPFAIDLPIAGLCARASPHPTAIWCSL